MNKAIEELKFKEIEESFKTLSLGKAKEELKRKEVYALIKKMRNDYRLSLLLSFFSIAKSSYYNWLKTSEIDKDAADKILIKNIFDEHLGRYGHRRITKVLRENGRIINHKKVLRLMKELNLQVISKKKI